MRTALFWRESDEILGGLKGSFGLGAVILRDAGNRVVAAAPIGSRPVAEVDLSPDTLFPAEAARLRFGTRGLRIPAEGGRLKFEAARGSASVELWERDREGLSLDESRTLAIAASILALEVSRRQESV